MFINAKEYNKANRKINSGWDKRVNGVTPKSLLIHTTNGAIGSKFENECKFIYNSNEIGAHFLIGKQGQIIQFLDTELRAHHAGAVNDKRFNNNNSIGIENHYTIGEGLWPKAMKDALTDLCTHLTKEYNITDVTAIETHRKVAVFANGKTGRKIDPSGFIDDDFYRWRKGLFEKKENNRLYIYKALFDGINIRQGPNTKYPIAGKLKRGDIVTLEIEPACIARIAY